MPGVRNLFTVDCNAILSTLIEANSSLLKRRDETLAEFQRLPDRLILSQDLETARGFAEKAREAQSVARNERLSDEKPFKEGLKTISDFYQEIEKSLGMALRSALDRLGECAAQDEREKTITTTNSQVVAVNNTHEAAVRTNTQSDVLGNRIRLAWRIKSVNPKTVDLEELREYLTEKSLLAACRKLLVAQGNRIIAGVEFERTAEID